MAPGAADVSDNETSSAVTNSIGEKRRLNIKAKLCSYALFFTRELEEL
jgi:hypothetical protein